MRVLQIERLAPQAEDVPLHPRLTVVVGAAPGSVARLRSLFAALVGAPAPAGVDPVLELGPPRWHPSTGRREGPPAPTPPGPPPGQPPGPPPGPPAADDLPVVDPAATGRDHARRELARLEQELRSAAGERMVLERRIVDVRVDLDPFAPASLEAARAELAELVRRRESLGPASELAADRARAAVLEDELARLDGEERRLTSVDPEPLRRAVAELEDALARPIPPDPAAVDLADRLAALAEQVDEHRARAAAVADLLARAGERLADARSDLEAAGAAADDASAATVARLEAVRDGIVALSGPDRAGQASGGRRHLAELRAEEAVLLDRLGFETYSAFLVAGGTAPPDPAAAARVAAAAQRVEVLAAEVEHLRGLAADGPPGRRPLVEEAAALVGVPADRLDRLSTDELVDLLTSPRPATGPSRQAADAADAVVAALAALGAPAPGRGDPGDPAATAALARAWLQDHGDPRAARRDLAGRRARLAEELDSLRSAVVDAVSATQQERADVDAAVAAAQARIADDEARLARHEVAMARLSELRAEDLRLAERQDELRARAEERRRVLDVLGGDPAAGSPADPGVVADVRSVERPDAGVPVASVPEPAAPDRAWRVLERVAQLRSVPGLGPVPLLVLGVEATGPDTADLLRRLERLSATVQVVVVTDDEEVATWAAQLGPSTAAVVRP